MAVLATVQQPLSSLVAVQQFDDITAHADSQRERLQENPECTWAVCIYAVLWRCSILGLFAHFFLQSYLSPQSAKEGGNKAESWLNISDAQHVL